MGIWRRGCDTRGASGGHGNRIGCLARGRMSRQGEMPEMCGPLAIACERTSAFNGVAWTGVRGCVRLEQRQHPFGAIGSPDCDVAPVGVAQRYRIVFETVVRRHFATVAGLMANPDGVNGAGLLVVSDLKLQTPASSTRAHFGISEPNQLAATGATTTDIRFSTHQWNGNRGSDPGVSVLSAWHHPRHVARGQIKRTRGGGRGLATAALVIGYLQLAVTVGVISFAAILVALGAQ